MPSHVRNFADLNHEITKHRDNVDRVIALCEEGMEQLPDMLTAFAQIPRSITCRDTLIQAYAQLDQFDYARTVVDRAHQAGSYLPGRKEVVLARIKAMETASAHLLTCVSENPGIQSDQAISLLTNCDRKALNWYISHTKTIKKLPTGTTYMLWFLLLCGYSMTTLITVKVIWFCVFFNFFRLKSMFR